MDSVLLQDWTTARGGAQSILSITQDQSRWLDLSDYGDVTFWVDVRETSVPSGTGGNAVVLFLDTAPSKEEPLFQPLAPPLILAASANPVVARSVLMASTAPLSRWVRWRLLTTTNGTGPWDATFRIRAVCSPNRVFSPLAIPGCALWLRADAGITLASGTTSVSTWADQSTNGLNATQSTSTKQPSYSTSALNGKPAVSFNGTSQGMQTASSSAFSGTEQVTLFLVGNGSISSATMAVELGPGPPNQGALEFAFGTGFVNANKLGFALDGGGASSEIGEISASSFTSGQNQVNCIYDRTAASPGDTVRYNRVAQTVTNAQAGTPPNNNFGSNNVNIGARNNGGSVWFSGVIGEVVVYSRALALSEITQVENYLASYWGTP
jgi:hypothetical protein